MRFGTCDGLYGEINPACNISRVTHGDFYFAGGKVFETAESCLLERSAEEESERLDWPWSGSRTCWTRFAHEPDPMFGFGFVFLAGPNPKWGPGSTPWVNLNLRSEPEPWGSMPNRRYLPTHQSMDDNLPPTAPQTSAATPTTPLSTTEHLVLINFLGSVGALRPHHALLLP